MFSSLKQFFLYFLIMISTIVPDRCFQILLNIYSNPSITLKLLVISELYQDANIEEIDDSKYFFFMLVRSFRYFDSCNSVQYWLRYTWVQLNVLEHMKKSYLIFHLFLSSNFWDPLGTTQQVIEVIRRFQMSKKSFLFWKRYTWVVLIIQVLQVKTRFKISKKNLLMLEKVVLTFEIFSLPLVLAEPPNWISASTRGNDMIPNTFGIFSLPQVLAEIHLGAIFFTLCIHPNVTQQVIGIEGGQHRSTIWIDVSFGYEVDVSRFEAKGMLWKVYKMCKSMHSKLQYIIIKIFELHFFRNCKNVCHFMILCCNFDRGRETGWCLYLNVCHVVPNLYLDTSPKPFYIPFLRYFMFHFDIVISKTKVAPWPKFAEVKLEKGAQDLRNSPQKYGNVLVLFFSVTGWICIKQRVYISSRILQRFEGFLKDRKLSQRLSSVS
ncbi:putative signal peptide protein [Puccinia sorghi]|uniref:Putative signal peptide protein n=1 Tax=Puccinia sorghi TaxID=27349 RepID=A0A0L6VT67_9BASI|nr:putative signal peptide protein [Puccinia sorghi]